ncbi:MAG: hypothetical protein H7175_01415 [Burkholderiales bacterium]|nr:hypothetical protein [Anaerolineae bacterium]
MGRGRGRGSRFERFETNPRNVFAGVLLLVLLLTFAGPRSLPQVLSNVIPAIDEAIPCIWLRQGIDRANHQSLIGRAASAEGNPISVSVRTTSVPTTLEGELVISIVVSNDTIGTVPFLFSPEQVIVGDNSSSGLGLIFDPPNSMSTGGIRQDTASYPENVIRVLGPRQRCIHKVAFRQLDGTVANGTARVRAYYRNNFAGQIQIQNTIATPIYNDQGLWTGYVESLPIPIPLPS